MATISTTLQLYDRISAPMSNIISAIENVCSAFDSVENSMDGGFDARTIESARAALGEAAREADQLGAEIDNAGKEQEDFNDSLESGVSAADGLSKKIMGIVGTYMGLQTVQKVVDISDEFTQTTARIGMMNNAFNELNGTETQTAETMDMIYRAAQDARGSFGDMADVVARFGNNAKDAFGSQAEVIAFATLVQKQMTIAGAGTAEASNAMLQLSQALGSGTLRGDELNSIFEQAPNLIQTIADYLNVPIGQIREMASEGRLSADIVKNAMFDAADDIDKQFDAMPKTWGQVWTSFQNTALMAFQPVLDKISEMAQNGKLEEFTNRMSGVMSFIADKIVNLIDLAVDFGTRIYNNWSQIEPIIVGIAGGLGAYYVAMLAVNVANGVVAASEGIKNTALLLSKGATAGATTAQWAYNGSLLACPITWIVLGIMLLIAVIYAVIVAVKKATGGTFSALGVIAGALMTFVAFLYNLILGAVDFLLIQLVPGINGILAFVNFLANVFKDPIGSIIGLFGDWANAIVGMVQQVASAIDKIFGTKLSSSLQGVRDKIDKLTADAIGKYGNGSYEKVVDMITLTTEDIGLNRMAYGKTYSNAYDFVDGLDGSMKGILDTDLTPEGFDFDESQYNLENIANNTGAIADSMEIAGEELEYLRDIAERETVNRFTTAEITIEQTNNNNINSSMDIDGIMDKWNSDFEEVLVTAAEGVHS